MLLQGSLPGTRRGQGRGRTFVWALLRARDFTWYRKVSFGIRLDQKIRVIFSCLTAPFYSDHLEDYFSSWVSWSPPIPSIVDHRTLCPLLRLCPFFSCLVAMVGLICPVLCSGCCECKAGKESRGREGQKAGSWGSAFFLRIIWVLGPGQHPTTESLRHLQSCRSHPSGPHTVILGAIVPCRAGSLGPPHPVVEG